MKLVLGIFSLLFVFTSAFAQYEIEEDDPNLNGFYLGLSTNLNNKSGAIPGLDLRTYLFDGNLNIDVRYNTNAFGGSIHVNKYNQLVQSAALLAHPIDGLKTENDFEIGICYNPTKRLTTRHRSFNVAISSVTNGKVQTVVHREAQVLSTMGIRAGFGSYRGIMNGGLVNTVSNFLISDSSILVDQDFINLGDKNSRLYTNFEGSYFYLGGQYTGIVNVKMGDVFIKRKVSNQDWYVDVIIPLKKGITDVRLNNSTKQYSLKPNDRSLTAFAGIRAGCQNRAARYARLTFGGEVGIMPGYKFNGLATVANNIDGSFIRSAYFKLNATISITAPIMKASLESFN